MQTARQSICSAKQLGRYLVCGGMKIWMANLSQAVIRNDETVFGTSRADIFMDLFIESSMQSVMALLRDIAGAYNANDNSSVVRLAFVKSGYTQGLCEADRSAFQKDVQKAERVYDTTAASISY